MNKSTKIEKVSYAIFILLYIVLLGYILQSPFLSEPSIWTIIGLSAVFVFFGVGLGVPKLLDEIRGEGKWKFDWFKLLILGIPIFMIYSLFLIDPGNNEKLYTFLYNMQKYLLNFNILIFIMTLLGFTLITLFYRDSEAESLADADGFCDGESCECCGIEAEADEADEAEGTPVDEDTEPSAPETKDDK